MLRQRNSLQCLSGVFFICLLMVLVLSCNQSNQPQLPETYYGEVARVMSGKVEKYTGDELKLTATPLWYSEYAVIGTGHIETDGNFKFSYNKLEHIIEAGAFSPITDLACQAVIPDEQETARIILTGTIQVVQERIEIGEIFSALTSHQIPSPDFRLEVNDYIVGRVGIDKDVTIKGSCKSKYFEFLGLELKGDYDLELKKGWNIVVLTATGVNEEGLLTAFRLETKPAPSAARWWYIELAY
jgi:hypothetical protein